MDTTKKIALESFADLYANRIAVFRNMYPMINLTDPCVLGCHLDLVVWGGSADLDAIMSEGVGEMAPWTFMQSRGRKYDLTPQTWRR